MPDGVKDTDERTWLAGIHGGMNIHESLNPVIFPPSGFPTMGIKILEAGLL